MANAPGPIPFSSKRRPSKRRPFAFPPRENRVVIGEISPRLRTKVYMRLAILRAYYRELSKPRKPRTKEETTRNFLSVLNSGLLFPEGFPIPRHVGRSALYNWEKMYKDGGIAALVPNYKVKSQGGRATFRPLLNNIEMKLPGPPTAKGKVKLKARIRRRWKNPPLECPIRLGIFYSMPIPKKTKMPRRMKMLRHEISHIAKPNLDALNAFIVDSMTGIVFKDYSQIIKFHAEKGYGWWPQTRIMIGGTVSR